MAGTVHVTRQLHVKLSDHGVRLREGLPQRIGHDPLLASEHA